MFYLDYDREVGINWELDSIMLYYNLWDRYRIRPEVEVSAGRRGFHFRFPGLTLAQERAQMERHLYDCPGHASFVSIRGGADIMFSRKGKDTVIPAKDIFDAIDILKSHRNI